MKVFPRRDFAETLVCFGRDIDTVGYYKTIVVYLRQPFRKWKCRGVSHAAIGHGFGFFSPVGCGRGSARARQASSYSYINYKYVQKRTIPMWSNTEVRGKSGGSGLSNFLKSVTTCIIDFK